MTPVEIPSTSNQKKIMFPRIAHYSGVIRYFIEVCMGQKYILPPKMTRHTLEIGLLGPLRHLIVVGDDQANAEHQVEVFHRAIEIPP